MHFLETEFFHPLKEKNLLQISNGAWAKRCFQIVSGVLRIEGLVRLAQWFLHCWVMNWIPSSFFFSSPAQLQISSALVPVSLLLHRKHESQPQQVSRTPAMSASCSSLYHCAFPEDGRGQEAGGTLP